MTREAILRTVFAGLLGVAIAGILGVLVTFASQAVFRVPMNRVPATAHGFKLVDGACVRSQNSLNEEIATLERQLEQWRSDIAAIRAKKLNEIGEMVAVPQSVPHHQTAAGFQAVSDDVVSESDTLHLVSVVCQEYPCIAVFRSTRDNFVPALRFGFRRGGLDWSDRRVVEGKSTSDEGTTHFGALRFYPGGELSPAQERYLSHGLEVALERAMDEHPGD
jgi:hypothetical protein